MPAAEYAIDYEKWRESKPFGISGCFRLRNESLFMEASIMSHMPYLDEAVLVVQPSHDDTVEKARIMAIHDERIKVYEYPFECDWIDTPGFYSKDPHAPGHLVHMSNWAFSKCKYSWISKVEGDVICLSSFADIVDRINAHPHERHYYGRVILNMAGVNCDQFSVTVPRNGGWDECVVPNHPDYHFERVNKWEVLQNPGPSTCYGWSALHMKRCKPQNIGWNGEEYAPLTRENVRRVLEDYNRTNHYPGIDDPNGAECLFEEVPWLTAIPSWS